MKRILVVEDNLNLAAGLRMNLEGEGFIVEHAATGEAALRGASVGRPALIILDLMLPGAIDGFEVLRRLRAERNGVPVLVLSARGEEVDKLRGFRLGADDYVTKPFGVLELIARVHAHLRRGGLAATEASASPIRRGHIEIWPGTRSVFRDGRSVRLRPKEYELLLMLMRRAGEVVEREAIGREVWGHQPDVYSRTLDTHIADLRRKLETDPATPQHILTVHKVGYRFV
jgi:DNA-binding response OmpR family regulator